MFSTQINGKCQQKVNRKSTQLGLKCITEHMSRDLLLLDSYCKQTEDNRKSDKLGDQDQPGTTISSTGLTPLTGQLMPVSELQELCAQNGFRHPEYRLVRTEGNSHSPLFTIKVFLNGMAYV